MDQIQHPEVAARLAHRQEEFRGRDRDVHLDGPRRQYELPGPERRDGEWLANRRAGGGSNRRPQMFAMPVRFDTKCRMRPSGLHRGLSSNHVPSVIARHGPPAAGIT